MARQSNGASALSRAVRILEAFSVDAPFLGLHDVSQRAGIPISSTYRIVAELTELGLLERLPDKSYRVGSKLWELGSRTPGVLGLREIALPFLHAVQSEVRQHTQLTVRSDLEVLVIDRISARDAVVNASIVGVRTPIELSASGIILLGAEGGRLVDAVIERGLAPGAAEALLEPEALRSAVAEAARLGYWVGAGYIYEGSRGIAAPIRGVHDVVVGAISVVVPNDGAKVERTINVVRAGALRISEALQVSYLPPNDPRARAGGVYRNLVNSSLSSMEYLEHRPD